MAGKTSDALTRYEDSGRVASRFWILALLGCAVSFGLGVAYQALIERSPYVALHVVFPMLLGFGVGYVTIAMLKLGASRNAKVVSGAVLISAASALGGAWFLWTTVDRSGVHDSYRSMRAALWVGEAIMVLVIGVAVPRTWFRRAAYSEADGRFVPRKLMGRAWGAELLTFRKAVGENGLQSIFELGLRKVPGNETEGEYRFWLREGTAGAWMTVWWHGHLAHPRGKQVRRDVLVLRRIVVDKAFLARLKALLAQA